MTEATKSAVARATKIRSGAGNSEVLQRKVEELRSRTDPEGLRKVEPVDLMEMTPNQVTHAPPEALWLAPTDLWIDGRYQRNLSRESLRLILKIVTNWSWQKFKPPVVTRDDEGRYCIIDGQHTSIAAATHPDIIRIPVMFIPISSLEEAALAFIAHNTDRVLVTPFARFRARLAANDRIAIDMKELLGKINIVMKPYTGVSGAGESMEPNQTSATAELERRFVQLGDARFYEMMSKIAECGFKPIRREHIVAFYELMYGEHKQGISPELLVEVVRSLSDVDALMNARRMSQSVRGLTQGKALAMHYGNRYATLHGLRKAKRDAVAKG